LVKLPEFRYDRHGSFRAWLRTVTLNKWRENLRRRRLPTRQFDDEELAELPGREDGDLFAEAEYHRGAVHPIARSLIVAAISICPSGEELQRFARGTLEASSAERIIHHLYQCRTCLVALEGAPVEDTLIEALQTWGNAGVGVEKAAVEGLIQRLKKLAVGAVADPEATAADAPAAKTERFDFLTWLRSRHAVKKSISAPICSVWVWCCIA
jgi:hypothetical protein